MKKKWWIILIIVILLIGGGIAWYSVYENNLPECEKEYRACMERQHAGYDELCFSCRDVERMK